MSFDNGIGTVWTPYSGTGLAQITGGGYGVGPYGEGGYGEGSTTTILVSNDLVTAWTAFGNK